MVTNVQNPMMAAILGPEAAQSQYQLAQNQRYADIMMQQALQEQPQGQMVSGHYVPASPVQGLAQLLKAYVGRSVADKIPAQQAAAGQAQMQQIQNMFAPADGGGASGVGGQLNSLVPPGMTPQQAAFSMMISPDALVKGLISNTSPTQTAKLLRESGINPNSPQGQQYMGQALEKDISQVLPPGSTLRGPNGMLNIPKADVGQQLQFGPQGQATAFAVPNAAQLSAQAQGMTKFAEGLAGLATSGQPAINERGQGVASTQLQNLGGVNAVINPFAPQQTPLNQNTQATPVAAPQSLKPAVLSASPIEQEVAKGLNEDWRKNVLAPARVAASAADNILSSVDVLQSLDFKTGFSTKAQAEVAGIFAAMGVKGAEKLATNAQLFEKEGAKALLNTLEKQKGSQTERDAITGKETFVRLSDTPQAKDFTLDLARSMALRDKHKADYFNRAVNMSDEHKGKLDLISEAYKRVDPSVFDMTIGQTPDGKKITMRTKYGIK
jgi:hypothetical protein